jgi:hypothetical protein
MPNMRVNVTVKTKANILNGAKTKAAGARLVIEMNDVLAQEAMNRVLDRLGRSLKHPTGYYQSRISVERRAVYRGVTDNRVRYGGWLEGVDPRNRTTRFKGYHTFREVKQSINRDKERIIAPVLRRYRAELS